MSSATVLQPMMAVEVLRGRELVWLATSIPPPPRLNQGGDGVDVRETSIAHRIRAAVVSVVTSSLARSFSVVLRADPVVLTVIMSAIRGQVGAFSHPRIVLVQSAPVDATTLHLVALAPRGSVAVVEIPQTTRLFGETEWILSLPDLMCGFFVGGSTDVVEWGTSAISHQSSSGAKPRAWFALGTAGPGSSRLLTTYAADMANGDPGLARELATSRSLAVAVHRCLDSI